MGIPFVFDGGHRSVIEKLSPSFPCQPFISAVVFLVDCSNPQPGFLAQPEFHSLEGIGTDITECRTGCCVAIVVRPSPEEQV